MSHRPVLLSLALVACGNQSPVAQVQQGLSAPSRAQLTRLTPQDPGRRVTSFETGQVRQSFSHGRSKTVTVEVRKKRTVLPGGAPEPTAPAGATPAGVAPAGAGSVGVSPAGVSPAGFSTVARAQPAGPAPATNTIRRCGIGQDRQPPPGGLC